MFPDLSGAHFFKGKLQNPEVEILKAYFLVSFVLDASIKGMSFWLRVDDAETALGVGV